MSVILLATGLIGLFVSFALLHFGVREMWVRYPLAVVAAYACCLGMVRLWVEYERRCFDPAKLQPRGPSPAARQGQDDWLDLRDVDIEDVADVADVADLADGEGCLVSILVIGILTAVIGVFAFAIAGASTLLAEVFLDAFFVSVLYRRLRVAAVEHWLASAVRKTWGQALLLAILLGLLGLVLDRAAPGSESIGPALHEIFDPSHDG